MALVRVVLPEGIDDHPRPDVRPFKRVVPPLTQLALWLYQDGTVVRMDRVPDVDDANPPDDIAGAGHDGVWDEAAWQVTVLTDAGYDFEPVLF